MEEEMKFENLPRVKTVEEWRKILVSEKMRAENGKNKVLSVLEYFYGAEDFVTCCKYADEFLDWPAKAANGVLTNFGKRVVVDLGIEEQVREKDGSKRYWNVAFRHAPRNVPGLFMMQMRPELAEAIELEFPSWKKNVVEPVERLARESRCYKREPLKDEEILLNEATFKIAAERLVNQEVTDEIEAQPNYYREAVAGVWNSYDGRKVEEQVFEEEYRKLEGKVPEDVLKEMKSFFEKRKDRYGYDVLSYDMEKGRKKYIEVKSTRAGESAPFYLTANEVRFAREHLDDYYVYREVVGKGMMVIPGRELFRDFYVKPDKYVVYGYPEMNDEKALELVGKLEWIFAKTYAEMAPHEYAIVKVGDKYRSEVVAFMKFIFENGVTESFYGKPFTVYYLGDRKYWCMARDKEYISDETYILNRTVAETTNKKYEDGD